jgi:hypothetical protein
MGSAGSNQRWPESDLAATIPSNLRSRVCRPGRDPNLISCEFRKYLHDRFRKFLPLRIAIRRPGASISPTSNRREARNDRRGQKTRSPGPATCRSPPVRDRSAGGRLAKEAPGVLPLSHQLRASTHRPNANSIGRPSKAEPLPQLPRRRASRSTRRARGRVPAPREELGPNWCLADTGQLHGRPVVRVRATAQLVRC